MTDTNCGRDTRNTSPVKMLMPVSTRRLCERRIADAGLFTCIKDSSR